MSVTVCEYCAHQLKIEDGRAEIDVDDAREMMRERTVINVVTVTNTVTDAAEQDE